MDEYMQKFFMKSENFCLYYLKFPYICSIILYKRRSLRVCVKNGRRPNRAKMRAAA